MNLIEIYRVKERLHMNRYENVIYECVDMEQVEDRYMYRLKFKPVFNTVQLFNDTTGDYLTGWMHPEHSNSVIFTKELVKELSQRTIGVVMVLYTPII